MTEELRSKTAIVMNNSLSCPCKGCKKRHENCHGDCKNYLEYRVKLEESNRLQREALRNDSENASDGWSYARKRKKGV